MARQCDPRNSLRSGLSGSASGSACGGYLNAPVGLPDRSECSTQCFRQRRASCRNIFAGAQGVCARGCLHQCCTGRPGRDRRRTRRPIARRGGSNLDGSGGAEGCPREVLHSPHVVRPSRSRTARHLMMLRLLHPPLKVSDNARRGAVVTLCGITREHARVSLNPGSRRPPGRRRRWCRTIAAEWDGITWRSPRG